MTTTVPDHSVTKKMFCGICESSCGLIATVRDDVVVKLLPDPEHPNSTGFACSKGINYTYVSQDPDRVLEPLKRHADGSFHPVSWDEALDDIGARLRAVIKAHGKKSLGLYYGNPLAWNYAGNTWIQGMARALGTRHLYGAGSVDINNYWVVGQLLYGNNMINPFPDLHRTSFFLVLGANPVLSHGSMMTVGRVRETMLDITERGGRVVVVDPRRSETAELFEHVFIKPDSDAWFVAAMLRTVIDRRLADESRLAQQTSGWKTVRDSVMKVDVERASRETGIPLQRIETIAIDFATAESAVLYGRCGASLGRFSTLTKYLIDVFNIATGNLDRPGGYVFGHGMGQTERMAKISGMTGFDRWRSRVDGFPEVMGTTPLISLPREIRTAGAGQLRALLVCSGNFRITGPAGDDVDGALAELDLMVSLDHYVTDTSRHAHYILPATTWLERDGMPLMTAPHSAVPYAQWVPATVPPAGQARDDWWILDQICRRIKVVPSLLAPARWLGRLGLRLDPQQTMDVLIRTSPDGDMFGLRRGGLSRAALWRNPGGIKLADAPPTGVLKKHLYNKEKRVRLDQPLMREQMRAMHDRAEDDGEFPLRLISLRELRGQNSWMHNVPKLMAASDGQRLRIHPDDAAVLSLDTGDEVEVRSRHGAITVRVKVSDEVMPGVLALQQGWGHKGEWRRAVAAGGANYNQLCSNDRADADSVSGQAILNGVRVQIRRIAEPSRDDLS